MADTVLAVPSPFRPPLSSSETSMGVLSKRLRRRTARLTADKTETGGRTRQRQVDGQDRDRWTDKTERPVDGQDRDRWTDKTERQVDGQDREVGGRTRQGGRWADETEIGGQTRQRKVVKTERKVDREDRGEGGQTKQTGRWTDKTER